MLIANLSNRFLTCANVLLVLGFVSLTSCDYFSRRILTKPVVQVENLRMTTQDFSKELARRLKDYDALSAKDPKILTAQRDQIINDFVISSVVDLWFVEKKLSIKKADLDIEIKNATIYFIDKSIPVYYFVKNVDIKSTGKFWDIDSLEAKISLKAGIGTGQR